MTLRTTIRMGAAHFDLTVRDHGIIVAHNDLAEEVYGRNYFERQKVLSKAADALCTLHGIHAPAPAESQPAATAGPAKSKRKRADTSRPYVSAKGEQEVPMSQMLRPPRKPRPSLYAPGRVKQSKQAITMEAVL